MATYGIRIEGLDELVTAASRAGGAFPRKLLGTMVKATTIVQEDAKRIGPGRFKNQTGNLRRSIFRQVDGPHRGVIGVGERYGAYVEFGTRPHVIRPKKGKFLAFKSSSGKTIYAKKINHPGSKPYPYMEPAFRNNADNIIKEYDRLALEMVKEMAK